MKKYLHKLNIFSDHEDQIIQARKFIVGGGACVLIFSFLPWWVSGSMDFMGERFSVNAFSGAASLAGTIAFLLALFTLILQIMHLTHTEIPDFVSRLVPSDFLEMFFSTIVFLMVSVSISIYLSPEFSFSTGFGSSIVNPGLGVGIYFSLLGSILMLVGSWRLWKH